MSKKQTGNQTGIFQLTGETQKMMIYRKKNGEYAVKKKSPAVVDRFANDPNFEQVRLNALDFAKAGKASMLIKRAFHQMTPQRANTDLFPRLTKLCKAIMKTDMLHERGQRNLLDGDTNLFVPFDFTEDGRFSNNVQVSFTHSVNRVAGNANIELPEFIPTELIIAPPKATHCRLKMGVAVLNFETVKHTFSFSDSADILLDATPAAPQTLTVPIPANSADPVFIALSIEFTEEENGVFYPINNGKFKLMQLVAVDVPV